MAFARRREGSRKLRNLPQSGTVTRRRRPVRMRKKYAVAKSRPLREHRREPIAQRCGINDIANAPTGKDGESQVINRYSAAASLSFIASCPPIGGAVACLMARVRATARRRGPAGALLAVMSMGMALRVVMIAMPIMMMVVIVMTVVMVMTVVTMVVR